ncbi:hypothetical protein Sphch_3150 [Sphingobium chlorophenolicum L-1]|uniref:Uncharacterized protein n=1 Tax=Sphingobium chlorophenolicum L-1 TaxID=690566 RepID=F6F2V3_SPHCR|nr:hypothetical protein Sphch_3150 [Sphingobium chlorophenolicum L-1]
MRRNVGPLGKRASTRRPANKKSLRAAMSAAACKRAVACAGGQRLFRVRRRPSRLWTSLRPMLQAQAPLDRPIMLIPISKES